MVAAVNGAIAVSVGAYAAHGADAALGVAAAELLRTGARYQMWHALALLGLAVLARGGDAGPALAAAGWAFLAGIVLFSGGLYALALTWASGLAAVVPVGGVSFVVGWIALAWHGLRRGGP